MGPPPNPLDGSVKTGLTKVSLTTYVIAGIKCNVFGLKELPPSARHVACLWLLNPRLQTAESMEPLAHRFVSSWNSSQGSSLSPGLIAVSFDQRNHGVRQIDAKANEAWRQGNGLHAQDMFSIFHGTALDVSQLLRFLPSYAFPAGERVLDMHMVLGVSLGGHAVWHCLLGDPLITTGIAVVGCPDYLALMKDRARLSKLKTYTDTDPPGASFVGSTDFPTTLLDAVDAYDPAGLLMRRTMPMHQPAVIGELLGGKRVLNLSGGDDKLVPYSMGKPFLDWFKSIVAPTGQAAEHDVEMIDKVFPGVGHEMTPAMVDEAIRFVEGSLKRHSQYHGEGAKL